VAGDNPGAFLSAMLEGVKTVVRQFRGIRMTENAEHTAIMFGVILLHRLLAPAAELSQTETRCARRKETNEEGRRKNAETKSATLLEPG
jgi:hypothetical protein